MGKCVSEHPEKSAKQICKAFVFALFRVRNKAIDNYHGVIYRKEQINQFPPVTLPFFEPM
jgi:hypothetical protein